MEYIFIVKYSVLLGLFNFGLGLGLLNLASASASSIWPRLTSPAVCLWSRLHLESIHTAPARNTESCWLGLDKEGWSMAGLLDNISSYCRELPAADQVCMQGRMSWKMQMLPLWPNLLSIM